jgi:hypothetical protein
MNIEKREWAILKLMVVALTITIIIGIGISSAFALEMGQFEKDMIDGAVEGVVEAVLEDTDGIFSDDLKRIVTNQEFQNQVIRPGMELLLRSVGLHQFLRMAIGQPDEQTMDRIIAILEMMELQASVWRES